MSVAASERRLADSIRIAFGCCCASRVCIESLIFSCRGIVRAVMTVRRCVARAGILWWRLPLSLFKYEARG